MDLYILDESLTLVAVMDSYKSLIWTTRYYSAGDFELYLPATDKALSMLKPDYYIVRQDNDRVMMIEKIRISTDVENGNFLIVSGKSIENILHRRIVWTQTNLSGSAEQGLRRLITENIISPAIEDRKIANFKLGDLKNYTDTLTLQTTGDYLDEITKRICEQFKWGWKVTLKNKNFIFDIYKGQNRGVTFSPEFDNLINLDYQMDKSGYANVALVAGEGEGVARKKQVVGSGGGLNRRELFVDARDVSSNDEQISEADYNELLKQRGNEKLLENATTETFESEVAHNMTYHYKTDYDLGDEVTVENEYGIKAKSRIIEIIESDDDSGYKVVPTFEDWSV